MDHIHLAEWLKVTIAGWFVVSIIAAPLIGHFLKGALRHDAGNDLSGSRPGWSRNLDNPKRLL